MINNEQPLPSNFPSTKISFTVCNITTTVAHELLLRWVGKSGQLKPLQALCSWFLCWSLGGLEKNGWDFRHRLVWNRSSKLQS